MSKSEPKNEEHSSHNFSRAFESKLNNGRHCTSLVFDCAKSNQTIERRAAGSYLVARVQKLSVPSNLNCLDPWRNHNFVAMKWNILGLFCLLFVNHKDQTILQAGTPHPRLSDVELSKRAFCENKSDRKPEENWAALIGIWEKAWRPNPPKPSIHSVIHFCRRIHSH